MLLHALLLELAGGKNHVHDPSTCAEATLALRKVTLLQLLQETIEQYACKDLASDG